jgi:hypothetical protein
MGKKFFVGGFERDSSKAQSPINYHLAGTLR